MSTKQGEGTKENPIKLPLSQMVDLLFEEHRQAALGSGVIFGMDNVCVGAGDTPYLRSGRYRFGVESHLHGGSPTYKAGDVGDIGVYEMVTRAQAIKEEQEDAVTVINQVKRDLPAAQERLAKAQEAHSAKPDLKKTQNELRVATNKVTALQAKQSLAQLWLTDPEAASKQQLLKKVANRSGDIAKAIAEASAGDVEDVSTKMFQDTADSTLAETEQYELKLAREAGAHLSAIKELQARRAKDAELLDDPIQALLARYRNFHLKGLLGLRIRGKHYVNTTPTTPALPKK